MTQDDSKGFEFNNIEDSDITHNSANGFNKAFEVNDARRINFSYNTADRQSRQAIDKFLEIDNELSSDAIQFEGKDDLQDLIQGVVESLNTSSPRKGILNSFHQSINSVITGAVGGILADNYPGLLDKINDAIILQKIIIGQL